MSARREKRRAPNGAEKWYWPVDFVFRHPDGRNERIRRLSPVNNKRGAEAYERELREALLGGSDTANDDLPRVCSTLATFAEEFLSSYAKVNNKPSETHTKERVLRVHLVPIFGSKALDAISVRNIEAYKKTKLDKGYEAKSINNQLGVLRKVLRTTVEWGMLENAPAIKPLRARKPEVRFLTFHEARLLVEAAEPEWRAMIVTALHTGLRLGELMALRWRHVDLERGHLLVCENDWYGIIGTPKGHRARVVPLNQTVLEALKAHQHDRGPLVFCRSDGTRLSYQRCRRPLLRMCKRAGIKPVQWHALRHTFTSHMAMRGAPLKAVQDLLGHVTIEMTMRYAHCAPEVGRSAVALLDAS